MSWPSRRARIPDWPPGTFDAWTSVQQAADQLVARVGAEPGFDEVDAWVRTCHDAGRLADIDARLSEPNVARALIGMWAHGTNARRSLTASRIEAIRRAQRGTPSRFLTQLLARILLTHFDLLDRWNAGAFDALAALVRSNVAHVAEASGGRSPARGDLVAAVAAHPTYLTEQNGPELLVVTLSTPGSLEEWLDAQGLLGLGAGRFVALVRHARHLTDVRAADPTAPETLTFLETLVDLKDEAGARGEAFGVHLLRALTSTDVLRPAEVWVKAATDIAGDPRSRHLERWILWWGRLEDDEVAKAVRWMAAGDLEVFLAAVEAFAKERAAEGKPDLLRMFPDRKTFLEGLFDIGLIRESRLVAGSEARSFMRRAKSGIDVLELTGSNKRDTSMVVLDCDGFHLVEGSHLVRLWLFDGPAPTSLLQPRRRRFTYDELTTHLGIVHAKRHPDGDDAHMAIPHSVRWQGRAVRFLVSRLGIDLDVERLMPAEAYRQFLTDDGYPVTRRTLTRRIDGDR